MTFRPQPASPIPTYFAENRLPAHSDHRWFARRRPRPSLGASSFEQCLNGLWKFHYAKNPALASPGFEALDFDCASLGRHPRCPAHIQLQGYDRPQYTNVQYPWDGQEDVGPARCRSGTTRWAAT